MSRITVRRASRIASTPVGIGAVVVGLCLGLAAGFVLGELAGPAPLRSLRRGRRQPQSVADLVVEAQAALDGDLPLRDCPLQIIPVGRGRIELHGWVNDRSARLRAERLVREAVPADAVINCVLVRGEDDPVSRPDQPDDDELLA